MKGVRKEYNKLSELPRNAITVRQYADKLGFTVAYIYKMQKEGKVNIATFAGINFVILEY